MRDTPEQDLRITPAVNHAAGVRGVAVAEFVKVSEASGC